MAIPVFLGYFLHTPAGSRTIDERDSQLLRSTSRVELSLIGKDALYADGSEQNWRWMLHSKESNLNEQLLSGT